MNKKQLLEKLLNEEKRINIIKSQLNDLKLAYDFITCSRYSFEIKASGDNEYPCSVKINKKTMSDGLRIKLTNAIREEIEELQEELKKLESEWEDES